MSAHKLIIQNIKLHYGKTKLGEKYRDITELIKLLKLISLLISIL